MKTYILNHTIFFVDRPTKTHKIKIKNCLSDLHAKIRLGDYLKRKHSNFERLQVDSCHEESDLFNLFGDIFKPFK
jgi:hypothetical protein